MPLDPDLVARLDRVLHHLGLAPRDLRALRRLAELIDSGGDAVSAERLRECWGYRSLAGAYAQRDRLERAGVITVVRRKSPNAPSRYAIVTPPDLERVEDDQRAGRLIA